MTGRQELGYRNPTQTVLQPHHHTCSRQDSVSLLGGNRAYGPATYYTGKSKNKICIEVLACLGIVAAITCCILYLTVEAKVEPCVQKLSSALCVDPAQEGVNVATDSAVDVLIVTDQSSGMAPL
jgi:hypothetical protein